MQSFLKSFPKYLTMHLSHLSSSSHRGRKTMQSGRTDKQTDVCILLSHQSYYTIKSMFLSLSLSHSVSLQICIYIYLSLSLSQAPSVLKDNFLHCMNTLCECQNTAVRNKSISRQVMYKASIDSPFVQRFVCPLP